MYSGFAGIVSRTVRPKSKSPVAVIACSLTVSPPPVLPKASEPS